jgi:hypothetical protein
VRRRDRRRAEGFRRGKKKALRDEIRTALDAEVAALVGAPVGEGFDFEAVEVRLRAQALSFAARAVEAWLNADGSDYAGPRLPCPCGGPARFAGSRRRTFVSALGDLRLVRAYYHCGACGRGFCPRDAALGMADGRLTPGALRMVGAVGAAVSFGEGAGLLRELAGVVVPAKQVERHAERLGAEAEAFERESVPEPESAPAPVVYLGQDGTGVPMRREALAGRAGKQADGTSKTREMKLCVVWTAEGRGADGRPTRDPGSVKYTAAIESAETKPTDKVLSPFARRVEREARRGGYHKAKVRVAIGDGAPWLWNIVEECHPDAIQILDKYHAKEHAHQVAGDVFGHGTEAAREWARLRCDEMDSGDIDALIAAVSEHSARSEAARTCAGYFERNRARMDYAKFEEMGLCVGSGVVEAGCKTAIGARMKRAGMRWTERGANAIAALRCCRLSGRFEDFWEWRVQLARPAA